jgi:cell division protein FtsN
LERAAALYGATRPQAHHNVHCSATEHGFTVEVGDRSALEAKLECDIWHVMIWKGAVNTARRTCESDAALLAVRDELVGLIVASDPPAAGRREAHELTTDRRRMTPWSSFTVFPWTGSSGAGTAAGSTRMRQVKLAAYIMAFAGGLMLSIILVKHSDHPQAPPSEIQLAVSRHTVAGALRAESRRLSTRTGSSSRTHPSRPAVLRAAPSAPAAARVTVPQTLRPAPQSLRPAPQFKSKNAISGDAPSSSFVTPVRAPGLTDNRQAVEETPRFRVQVGVFSARQDAEALVRRLVSLGYAAGLDEEGRYRVWVGGSLDRETAERLVDHLSNAGFDAVIVGVAQAR